MAPASFTTFVELAMNVLMDCLMRG